MSPIFPSNKLATFSLLIALCKVMTFSAIVSPRHSDVVCPVIFLNSATKNNFTRVSPLDGVTRAVRPLRPPLVTPFDTSVRLKRLFCILIYMYLDMDITVTALDTSPVASLRLASSYFFLKKSDDLFRHRFVTAPTLSAF